MACRSREQAFKILLDAGEVEPGATVAALGYLDD